MAIILITGGTGFIGSNLVHKLNNTDNEIHLLIRKSSNLWRIKNIYKKLNLHITDISNKPKLKKIIQKINPEIIFHCAAYGVKSSENNYSKLINYNINGTVNLFSSLEHQNNIKKIVNLGSVFEYGLNIKPKQYSETDFINPITPYGICKSSQTNFANYFVKVKNLPITTLRLFNAYGMYEGTNRLIPDIMLSLLNKKKMTISSFSSVRDFIFIDDVINALIKASKKSGIDGEIFNIGCGELHSVKNIFDMIYNITNTKPEFFYDHNKRRLYDQMGGKSYANIEKAKKILDWQPKFLIEDGLSVTYKWFKKYANLYNL